jgi:hypothetical protein
VIVLEGNAARHQPALGGLAERSREIGVPTEISEIHGEKSGPSAF